MVSQTAPPEQDEEIEKIEGDAQLSFGEAPAAQPSAPDTLRIAISAETGTALTVALDSPEISQPLKQALADGATPKTIHDSKSAMHVLAERGVELAGVRHDPLLYEYLLDPTYSTYRLRETGAMALQPDAGTVPG